MPIAWYLIPYLTDPDMEGARRLAIVDSAFMDWEESECMGDQAVVRVVDTQSQLDALTASYTLICAEADLDAVFSVGERAVLRARAIAAGYTDEQVDGLDPSVMTYKQWIAAMLTYRYAPRLVGGNAVVDGTGERLNVVVLPQWL